jgi:leader peptidase (prepilin peptidase)/N-methyltransferase
VPDFTWWEVANMWALSAFAAVWVFALGANLGSFLNVVVYRLPRGMPLALSVSRCPKCANPIAVRDNIPIISWLRLRGRCRACGQGISPRYPLVEAAVGGLLVLLFYVELHSGGANLPTRTPTGSGLVWLLTLPAWDLIALTCIHFALLYVLLGIALMQADRRAVPWKLTIFAACVGVAGAPVMVVPLTTHWPAILADSTLLQDFATCVMGLAAGVAWGVLHLGLRRASNLAPSSRRVQVRRAVLVALALVGMYLGWQAVTVVAVAAAGLRGIAVMLSPIWPPVVRVPSSAYVAVATLAQLVSWRWQTTIPYWPGPSSPLLLLAVIVAAATVVLALRSRPVAGDSSIAALSRR